MKIVANNKKAFHEYSMSDFMEAGIELAGSEVKSVRNGKVSFKDSFCKVENYEIFLYNLHISPYENASIFNHDPERPRRLLLHKKEILRLNERVRKEGFTIIPTKIYFNESGLIKVEIAVAKGKKVFDKREDLAKKDLERRMRKTEKYENI
jgi:SsrA-binding protein